MKVTWTSEGQLSRSLSARTVHSGREQTQAHVIPCRLLPQVRQLLVRGRETQLLPYAGLSQVGLGDHRNSGSYMSSWAHIFEVVETTKVVEDGEMKKNSFIS